MNTSGKFIVIDSIFVCPYYVLENDAVSECYTTEKPIGVGRRLYETNC